jgi:REP element-mobilizing transposase RayT
VSLAQRLRIQFHLDVRRDAVILHIPRAGARAERSSAFRFPVLYTDPAMPVSRRCFAPGESQFITSSVYRRRRLFASPRLRGVFVDVLRQLRQETGFLLIGWVLMPEHFHFLIRPKPAESAESLPLRLCGFSVRPTRVKRMVTIIKELSILRAAEFELHKFCAARCPLSRRSG